jgi:glycerol-3-phosphate acyltransferase PlsY
MINLEVILIMQIFIGIGILLVSYLMGSIPFGLVIVRLKTGKDIRQVESGRTGGTNAMRAAGLLAGVLTTVLDFLKSAAAVWLARWLVPGNSWLEVLAPIAAVLGHNYSIFLRERDALTGRLRLRGGAGGAPAGGGAFGLWPPTLFAILPVGLLIVYGIGYASLATMSIPLVATIIFAYRAWIGASPWQYVIYGIVTEIILIWALRPNILRLMNGTERLVGWRARRKNKQSNPRAHASNLGFQQPASSPPTERRSG